ncbi:MAG: diaminopimelate decarboxylase [Oscillospiraceae bacterium]|nr:diaminopimelate decarboxylase [Oscillospiraceae bacterium]
MKTAFVTTEKLNEIINKFPTPFHLYDEKGIRENTRRLREAFSWNKGFREYFAVKATPNPYIMKILQEEGCGFDCASYNELILADKVGSKHVMFSSNATPDEDFILAYNNGAVINLDDFTHIEILDKLCGIPETICCRYNPGGEFCPGGENEISKKNIAMDVPGEAKYGFTKEQIIEGFKILKSKGTVNFGIHAFLASNTQTDEYYPVLSEQLFKLAVELKEKTGIAVSFVNLSGGIGIPAEPDKKPHDIIKIGQGVKERFEKIMTPAGLGETAIYTELGRFMLGPYGHLITKAIREKHIYREYIGVDACACDLMRPAIYKAYHHITVAGKEESPFDHIYDITGGLCENNDKFAVQRSLPKIDTGDILIIHDTGAHGYSMGYNYNGKLRSAEILLCADGSFKQIRRAETSKDYFATFDFSYEFKF